MSDPTDGGPAFSQHSGHVLPGNAGISMRDYFAAAALQGLIASESGGNVRTNEQAASCAYTQADAMLAERAKGGGK